MKEKNLKNNYTFSSNEVKVINFFKVLYKNNTTFNVPTLSNCRYWLSDLVQDQYDCEYDRLINDSDKRVMQLLFDYLYHHHNIDLFQDDFSDEPSLKIKKLWKSLNSKEINGLEGDC